MPSRRLLLAALCLLPTIAFAQMAAAPFEGRLKQIHDSKTISVGYRTDALPFSYEETDKTPAGYTVDLCRSVVTVIERQIGVSPLQVKWVPVTTQTRFTAIASGQADMECGASTVTLGRMKEVSFSSLTFLDGTGLLVRTSTPGTSLADLSGKKIGVIAVIERQIGVSPLQVKWVPVTTQTRFTSIGSGQADMECGASTVTLGRMKDVSFSTLTFVDGTGLLIRASTTGNSLNDLAGKKIGVIAGTSNERALDAALKAKVLSATVVKVKSREEGLAQLETGALDAFASDRVLLLGLITQAKDPKALALLGDALSFEPYAIALPRGDWAMKQAVDSALAQIYRSSALPEIYNRWFGALGAPGPVLETMFGLGRLPD